MCGRVAVTDLTEIVSEFGIGTPMPSSWAPSYNLGPPNKVPVVRPRPESRRLSFLPWGLVPAWADDPKIGNRRIHAKVETVVEQPAFSEALRQRRCVVAVSGFFEWARETSTPQPFYITRLDGHPLALAGLWELWASATGEVLETCTIVTKPPVAPVAAIHNRMPAVLTVDAIERWLDGRITSPETLRSILHETPPELRAVPVSTYVNSVDNQGIHCIEPVEQVIEA